MKKLLLLALLVTFGVAGPKAQTNFENYCKAYPLSAKCYSTALGGTDTIKKERKREKFHDYVDGYHDDRRSYPSEDLDDPRVSL